MKKPLILVGSLLTSALLLTACSTGPLGTGQQWRDLEGVTVTDPDKVRAVTNVDTYPNVVALCIEGQGFVTSTRDYSSLIPVPAWGQEGGWCTR